MTLALLMCVALVTVTISWVMAWSARRHSTVARRNTRMRSSPSPTTRISLVSVSSHSSKSWLKSLPNWLITRVLDNARYQRKAYVMAEAERLGLTLLLVLAYSSHFNLMERRGKCVQAECLHSRYYPTFAPFKHADIDCVAETNDRHTTQLNTLLTLKFQTLKPAA